MDRSTALAMSQLLRSSRLIIMLTPTRLAAAAVSGKTVTTHTAAVIDPSAWEPAWRDSLKPLDQDLARVLDQLGPRARSAPATIIYASPTAVTQMYSLPLSRRAALSAAGLSLAEAAGYDLNNAVSAMVCAASDRSGTPRRIHVLAAAESNDTAAALTRWLQSAGVDPVAATTAEAMSLATLPREAIECLEGVRVLLRIGEHSSVCAASASGALRFVRHIAVGVEALAEPLTRPITPRTRPGETVRLSRVEALDLLRRVGVPAFDAILDDARGIRGSDVLPLIQPVLQRCIIELKQSLRFGLSEQERAAAEISLVGPGAGVPNLAEVLSRQLERPVVASVEAPGEFGWSSDVHPGDVPTSLPANLLEHRASAPRTFRRARVSMYAGALAATLALAADAGFTYLTLTDIRARIGEIGPAAEKVRAEAKEARLRLEADAATAAARLKAQREFANRADLAAVLADLARATRAPVRLLSITAELTPGASAMMVQGVVPADAPPPASHPAQGASASASATPVGRYASALAEMALVEAVDLGATERATDAGGAETQRFTLKLRLRPAPATLAALAESEKPHR